jgi:hypothetical protein
MINWLRKKLNPGTNTTKSKFAVDMTLILFGKQSKGQIIVDAYSKSEAKEIAKNSPKNKMKVEINKIRKIS